MIVAVIPCHNESRWIAGVVKETQRYVDDVIVVDNASSDDTQIVARQAGAVVVVCDQKGMGAATRCGVSQALEMGANVIVTLDGDGQHDPADIPLLTSSVNNGCALAIGSRDWGAMPKYRRVGNSILTWLACAGKPRLRDSQCGMRAFAREVAAIHTVSLGFGCVAELTIKARRAGFGIKEVPVQCRYHTEYRDNSTMNPVKHAVSVALTTLRWRLWEHLGV